jgi:hypothetical protein
MRWSLMLSELDFTVEHRPGTKILHADALSRHVGIISCEDRFSPEEVRNGQGKDQLCVIIILEIISANRNSFTMTKVSYTGDRNGKHQLLVFRELIRKVIRENHDPPYAAHPDVRRTCELLALNFWWFGICKTVEEYVRGCHSCQRQKRSREYTAPLGDLGNRVVPFEVTSIDITGTYPLTPRKNRYLLTFVDYFTK